MRKLSKLLVSCLTISIYLLSINFSPVLAATTTPASTSTPQTTGNYGQALEIAPPLIYLSVNPGQIVTTQIILRNISGGSLVVTSQVNDFVAAGEDGTPKILLNNDDNDPYSLRTWVSQVPNTELAPAQIKTLPVTLTVPANASPGGHYGVVRFTGTAPSLTGSNGVSLSASLGALMLVTVSGKITENLSIKHFTVDQNGKPGSLFQSGPLNFVELLDDTGNVHLQPTGAVAITDMFGRSLATLSVNVPPFNILPDSMRKFDQSLNKSVIGSKRLFGRYTAKLTLTYGTSKKVVSESIVFWVIPFKLIGIIILILVVGFFALRFGLKRYNRHILAKANGSSHKRPPQPPKPPQAPKSPPSPPPQASRPTSPSKQQHPPRRPFIQ